MRPPEVRELKARRRVRIFVLMCLSNNVPLLRAQVALPRPEGPYHVGFWETSVAPHGLDAQRTQEEGDLLVQFWYPSNDVTGARHKAYVDPVVAAELSRALKLPAGFAERVQVNAFLSPRAASGKFPLVLLLHGVSWPGILYQTIAESIASRGFVVAAVTFRHAAFIHYPDGRTLDNSAWPTFPSDTEFEKFLVSQVEVWKQGALRVIDVCTSWTTEIPTNPVAAHLATDLIAVVGHSFGGTVSAALLGDPHVATAVAMEGNARMPAGGKREISKPMLHLIGGYNRLEFEGSQYAPTAGGVLYEVIINGTGHAYFSDLIYMYKHFADEAWLARHRYEVEPVRVLQITCDYLAAFLGKTFIGRQDPLLQPVSYGSYVDGPRKGLYPEVDLRITLP